MTPVGTSNSVSRHSPKALGRLCHLQPRATVTEGMLFCISGPFSSWLEKLVSSCLCRGPSLCRSSERDRVLAGKRPVVHDAVPWTLPASLQWSSEVVPALHACLRLVAPDTEPGWSQVSRRACTRERPAEKVALRASLARVRAPGCLGGRWGRPWGPHVFAGVAHPGGAGTRCPPGPLLQAEALATQSQGPSLFSRERSPGHRRDSGQPGSPPQALTQRN